MADIVSLRIPDTIIGAGSSRRISKLVKKFEPRKILIVTDENIIKAGLADNVKSSLQEAGYKYDVFSGGRPNAPSSALEKCTQLVKEGHYDLLIGIGGGSNMDITKATSVLAVNDITLQDLIDGKEANTSMPVILVPSTAGTGSEWDEGVVITEDSTEQKRWIVQDNFLAKGVVIDPELTYNLPKTITADTGMDAFSHAIESYIAPGAGIISDMFAEIGIKMISRNLRLAYNGSANAVEARNKMSIAAAISMKAAILSGTSLAHSINNEVSIKAHISHGAAIAILLPHTMQFELTAAPERFAGIAELMGEKIEGLSVMDAAQKAIEHVKRLSKDLGMTQTLSGVGITEANISEFTDNLVKYRLPKLQACSRRQISQKDLIGIYRAAL